ncbi:MAG: helix-turn-helix domain protein [Phenylobacterium sp.]|jgi:transcriptional regulator with XRE-family HTH domain|uniref:helix-turn-helix domain-containing protein n=1 Tax=Phenylobacterium sp. TaxID=1871053 RepID=UPI0026223476|nr:helix-turn-helix transcriptional regulator [Phenylobacterium sp.]MDB5428230.1 helix-turn-helix domain protein [Phenylobacterium sp.]MDB5436158.1 helix-turn-helix domain protein [Phenylobacterium sp.]MDB5461949.1 helix-turn-helix domain protein [Phenylobacterium sp.]MDB5498560.1 helix-turn-helix domain protein [Phenylobacterium sp.]
MDEQAILRAVGRRLRQRRRLLSMTQRELAATCAVSFQQVHKYEAGLCSISVPKLVVLARALETSVSYFVDHLETEVRTSADADVQVLQAKAA